MRRAALLLIVLVFSLVSGTAQADIDHWESVVQDGTTWRFLIPSFEPIQYWKDSSFNDETWAEGPSGFGYGDGDDATVVPTTTSIYLRHQFTIDDLAWPAGSADRFILPDRLHPTTEGTIALAQMALRTLDADSKRFGSEDYLRDPEIIRSRLEARMVLEAREAGMAVKDDTGQPAPN